MIAGAEEQPEHWLAHHVDDDARQRPPVRARQLVGALRPQANCGLGFAEA